MKLGPRVALGGWLCAGLVAVGGGGCGYRSLASTPVADRLCVLGAPSRVPYPAAAAATLDGARHELARHGALRESEEYPCLLIELTRVDEVAVGAVAASTGAGEQPRARGNGVGVLGRGWVLTAPDAPTSRETGDVRRGAELEVSSGVAESTRHDRAVAAAGERLGRDLARSVLGLPVAADEPL